MDQLDLNRSEGFNKTMIYRALGTLLILICLFFFLKQVAQAQPPGFDTVVEKTSTFSGVVCQKCWLTWQ